MGAKTRNRYNQEPHLTQDTNGKVTNSQLYTTHESQEASPFPAGDHKAQINRRAQRHNKHNTEKNIKNPQKKYSLGTVGKIILLLKPVSRRQPRLYSDVDQDTFGKVAKHNKHGSQEVSPFPAGDHKATRNRHDNTTHTNMTGHGQTIAPWPVTKSDVT